MFSVDALLNEIERVEREPTLDNKKHSNEDLLLHHNHHQKEHETSPPTNVSSGGNRTPTLLLLDASLASLHAGRKRWSSVKRGREELQQQEEQQAELREKKHKEDVIRQRKAEHLEKGRAELRRRLHVQRWKQEQHEHEQERAREREEDPLTSPPLPDTSTKRAVAQRQWREKTAVSAAAGGGTAEQEGGSEGAEAGASAAAGAAAAAMAALGAASHGYDGGDGSVYGRSLRPILLGRDEESEKRAQEEYDYGNIVFELPAAAAAAAAAGAAAAAAKRPPKLVAAMRANSFGEGYTVIGKDTTLVGQEGLDSSSFLATIADYRKKEEEEEEEEEEKEKERERGGKEGGEAPKGVGGRDQGMLLPSPIHSRKRGRGEGRKGGGGKRSPPLPQMFSDSTKAMIGVGVGTGRGAAVLIPPTRAHEDVIATKALQDFNNELTRWLSRGWSDIQVEQARLDFAQHLTEKYLCAQLDTLSASRVVSNTRREVVRRIEQVARGGSEAVRAVRRVRKDGKKEADREEEKFQRLQHKQALYADGYGAEDYLEEYDDVARHDALERDGCGSGSSSSSSGGSGDGGGDGGGREGSFPSELTELGNFEPGMFQALSAGARGGTEEEKLFAHNRRGLQGKGRFVAPAVAVPAPGKEGGGNSSARSPVTRTVSFCVPLSPSEFSPGEVRPAVVPNKQRQFEQLQEAMEQDQLDKKTAALAAERAEAEAAAALAARRGETYAWKCRLCGKRNGGERVECQVCARSKHFAPQPRAALRPMPLQKKLQLNEPGLAGVFLAAASQANTDSRTVIVQQQQQQQQQEKKKKGIVALVPGNSSISGKTEQQRLQKDKQQKKGQQGKQQPYDFGRFAVMKRKTDKDAKERKALTGDIQGLLKALRSGDDLSLLK